MNVVPLKTEKPSTAIEQATQVIEFLNAKTGKKFSARNPRGAPTANADFVMARFREGYTVQDCKSVIALKCREWLHDEKMNMFLRPATLFCRQNFETYVGEIGPEDA